MLKDIRELDTDIVMINQLAHEYQPGDNITIQRTVRI